MLEPLFIYLYILNSFYSEYCEQRTSNAEGWCIWQAELTFIRFFSDIQKNILDIRKRICDI